MSVTTRKRKGCWAFTERIARAHAAILGWPVTAFGNPIDPQTGEIFDLTDRVSRLQMAHAIGLVSYRQRRQKVAAA